MEIEWEWNGSGNAKLMFIYAKLVSFFFFFLKKMFCNCFKRKIDCCRIKTDNLTQFRKFILNFFSLKSS